MSVFKKIGNAVKKGVKQISLKNAVKLGTPFLSAIPVVGGVAQSVVSNMSMAHEAKKAEQQALKAEADAIKAGNEAQAEAYRQQAEQQRLIAQANAKLAGQETGALAGGTIKTFAKGATDELLAQASDSTRIIAGKVGTDLADETIKAWFLKHWKHLLIAVGVIVAGLFFWKKSNKPKFKRRY